MLATKGPKPAAAAKADFAEKRQTLNESAIFEQPIFFSGRAAK